MARWQKETARRKSSLEQPKPFVTEDKLSCPRQDTTVGWATVTQSWGTWTKGSARGSPESPQQQDPVLPGLINKQACGKRTFFLQEI